MLQAFKIEVLADIRHFPGSRKFPQFNKENLQLSLAKANIQYRHFPGLGGRRKISPNSKNTLWHNASFRAYADYMETPAFKTAIKELEDCAANSITAIMCSEALWWRCHRSMVSDYLKVKGWKVLHIMSKNKTEEHPYTSPARIMGKELVYFEPNLFKP